MDAGEMDRDDHGSSDEEEVTTTLSHLSVDCLGVLATALLS